MNPGAVAIQMNYGSFAGDPEESAAVQMNYGGWFDSLKSGLAAVVPSNTIVGKWASGNTQGAITAAGNLAAQTIKPKASASPLAVAPTGGSGWGGLGMDSTTLLMVGGGLALAVFLLARKRR